MPIKTANIANVQMFVETLKNTIKGVSRASSFGHLDAKKVQATVPHTVYELGLTDVASGAGLDKARPIAQRFLLMQANQPAAAAEIPIAKDAPASRFAQLNDGPFVMGTHQAISEAERLPVVQRGEFELRLLRIPALYVVALWLHPTTLEPSGDLIIPVAPVPSELTAGHPYSAAELSKALATRAAEKLHFEQTKPPQ